ncbi:Putative phosphoribosyl transferase [archaeon HR06]|nr:Putative phosphoribosyl transferase [archaeon HR06]
MFKDRSEAGKKLVQLLKELKGKDLVVLAIPRGGVIVGYEIAKELKAKLDVIIPRKIGAPLDPELAIGAIGEDGTLYLIENLVNQLGVSKEYIEEEVERQLREIKRRALKYRKGREALDVKGKTVILVDDGLATGATMKAAIMQVKKREPKEIFVAVPVSPRDTLLEISKMVDKVYCLATPEPFFAIGQFYRNFEQVSDDVVIELLTNPF